MENIEVRSFDIELRDNETNDSRHIEGYGSVFNSRSFDLGGFTEVIAPGAFDEVIERSDVKAYLEHNPERGILARSKNGKGSLSLTIDERGLKYAFDAPHTQLGDEVVEGLKRGDYSQSSFAFTVESESWSKEADGTYLRTINKVSNLYDVSIVANPAYGDTSVALRSLDAYKAENVEEVKEVEETEENIEEKTEEEVKEVVEEENNTTEVTEEVTEEPKEERNNNNISIKKTNHMSKFSLIKTINDVVNNRNINEDALSVIENGATEMRKSGLSYSGQIQLPVEERDAPTAIVAQTEDYGKEIVATEKLDILAPLRGESILSKVGATMLTGLVGNISIPAYSGTTCGWKGELASADDGKGTFDTVELAPKRLTAYIDISKQFLVQDSVGAEAMLRADIVNALIAKLEQTIFGEAAGDGTKPAGIFNDATEANPSFGGACDDEADVVDYPGEKIYVMSPTAKSKFKQTTISGELSDLRMLMQDGEVNGYKVVSSSNVAEDCYAFGAFGELVVAQWGSIDIVVDPYSRAKDNAIRLVINAFFDAKVRRDGAIVAKKLED